MGTIWLVEDDRNLANFTRIALIKKGYEVVVFHEALKAVEETKNHMPDLILMDVMLPDISGPDAVKIFKKDPNLAGIPVIFLTALLSREESELGLTIDDINYKTLGKPYEIKDLMQAIENILS